MKKPPNNGLTPDKQKRRPGGGNPSPIKKNIMTKPKPYRPQGR